MNTSFLVGGSKKAKRIAREDVIHKRLRQRCVSLDESLASMERALKQLQEQKCKSSPL